MFISNFECYVQFFSEIYRLIDWLIDWDEEIVLDNTGFHDEDVFYKQNLTGCEHTLNGRIKRKFVSKNVVNLSKRKLTKLKVQDIFLLTKLLFNEKIRFYQWKGSWRTEKKFCH